ncbi:MAG: CHAT domain-containing protein, partial [Cyanobacteria bacterium P01_D01_bin.116]
IESKGNITVNGDIEITSLDSDICQSTCSADAQILANEAALILRAGVSELEEPAFNYPSEFGNPPISFNGTSFNSSGTTSSPANVTVNGDIITSFDVSTERVGRVIITAPGDINTQNIFTDYSSVEFFLNNLFGGEVNLKAGGNISTIDINSSVNLNAGDFVTGGNINLEAGGNIIVTDSISSGAFTFENVSQISGGEINLKAGGNIVVEDGMGSNVLVGSANDISAGKINIDSGGDIFVAEIESSVDVNGLSFPIPLSNNAFGGEVNLKAVGDIIMGPISSSVDLFAISDNGIAGNVNLATDGNIFVQDIKALVRDNSPSSNNVVAGNVSINSGENIVFGSVNTSNFNGTSSFDEENSPVGRGGDVKVIADNGTVRGGLFVSEDISEEEGFVRELELPDWLKLPEGLEITTEELKLIELNLPNTISTVGEDSSGTVDISHDGTIENIPFIVGDANINGTAGAINAGDNVILPTTEYPNAGTVNQGNISINFNNTAPDITVNSDLNISSANQPITFTLTDINQNISDANNDITSVQINQISDGGSLKINGIPATSGNIITSTDTLEYTPPANTTGEINAFTIVANDKISVSTPTAINVKIGDTQPVPQEPNQPLLPAPPQSQPPLLLKPDTTSNIVNRLEIDTMMGKVENYFTNSFKGHLGNAIAVDLVGLQEAREILNEVEKASGIRPALVYAMFVPPGLSSQTQNPTTNLKNDSDILEILIITAKGKPIRKQIRDATRADLLKVVRKFQREVSNPRKSHTKTYLQPSQQLYQWLIAPVQKELQIKGIQNLTFITDVGLRSIPFAALHNGNSFLVEQYSIGLMPSLSLTNTKYTDIKQAQVLAMGASKFNQQNPLPAVPLEINHISKQWQGKSFLNENFTAQNLKS